MFQDDEEYEKFEAYFLKYVEDMYDGLFLDNINDLSKCSSKVLLEIISELDDDHLIIFVALIKRADNRSSLFNKLMGEHDEENSDLVEDFFVRYKNIVMFEEDGEFNPLIAYIPTEALNDLAFVQSREAFFKRQTIAHINEFLQYHFKLQAEYTAIEHDQAWNYLMNKVIGGDFNG